LIFPKKKTFIPKKIYFEFQDIFGLVSKENQLLSKPENINLGKGKEDKE
jgi:hypothetical protein